MTSCAAARSRVLHMNVRTMCVVPQMSDVAQLGAIAKVDGTCGKAEVSRADLAAFVLRC